MHSRQLVTSLIMLAVTIFVGCGPTRTAGTGGVATKDLAVLSISQLPSDLHIQIQSVQFDGKGDQYKISKTSDFYLLPGEHTGTFSFVAKVPGMMGWLVPKSALIIPGPKEIPLGAVVAGKSYELALPGVESFDKLLEDGGASVSLMREKAK